MFILSRLKFKAHFEKVKHNKLFIGMKYSEIRLVMVAILKLILLIEMQSKAAFTKLFKLERSFGFKLLCVCYFTSFLWEVSSLLFSNTAKKVHRQIVLEIMFQLSMNTHVSN